MAAVCPFGPALMVSLNENNNNSTDADADEGGGCCSPGGRTPHRVRADRRRGAGDTKAQDGGRGRGEFLGSSVGYDLAVSTMSSAQLCSFAFSGPEGKPDARRAPSIAALIALALASAPRGVPEGARGGRRAEARGARPTLGWTRLPGSSAR